MPRKSKCRLVCGEPACRRFLPQSSSEGVKAEPVRLSVEELESLRLCDYEGLEQGQAAARMEISRGTFQRILYAARHKAAQALITGAELTIGGGRYAVREGCCPHAGGCRHPGARCCRGMHPGGEAPPEPHGETPEKGGPPAE